MNLYFTFEEYTDEIEILSFPVEPLDVNCTVLNDKKAQEAVVVDPGGNIDEILSLIDKTGSKVSAILFTHAHFDHCMHAQELIEKTKSSLKISAMHPEDFDWLQNLSQLALQFGITADVKPPEISHKLIHGENLKIGCFQIQVIHSPGHSRGSVSFYLQSHNLVIAGDTLFKGSVGRTDLKGGDFAVLKDSVMNKLYKLPDDTRVITGHGPYTTIVQEKKENSFFRG